MPIIKDVEVVNKAARNAATDRAAAQINTDDFSDSNLPPSALQWLVANIKHGENILEFGSGKASRELVKFFDVTSVEHDPEYAGAYSNVKYVVAPLVNGLYSEPPVREVLNQSFSAVILDGPPAYLWEKRFSRLGFLRIKQYINGEPVLVIDDAQRIGEFRVLLGCELWKKKMVLLRWAGKACVILIPSRSPAFFQREFWQLLSMAMPGICRELNLI